MTTTHTDVRVWIGEAPVFVKQFRLIDLDDSCAISIGSPVNGSTVLHFMASHQVENLTALRDLINERLAAIAPAAPAPVEGSEYDLHTKGAPVASVHPDMMPRGGAIASMLSDEDLAKLEAGQSVELADGTKIHNALSRA